MGVETHQAVVLSLGMLDNVGVVLEVCHAVDVVKDDALVFVVACVVLEVRPVASSGVMRVTAASLGLMLHSLEAIVFYNARGLHLMRQFYVVILLQVVDLPVKSLALV